MTRQPDRSRLGWLGRRPPNWWLRFAIPGLIMFGGGFVSRILAWSTDFLYAYGTGVALALVALVVGLIKVKRSAD